jgi:hypothetical protein
MSSFKFLSMRINLIALQMREQAKRVDDKLMSNIIYELLCHLRHKERKFIFLHHHESLSTKQLTLMRIAKG